MRCNQCEYRGACECVLSDLNLVATALCFRENVNRRELVVGFRKIHGLKDWDTVGGFSVQGPLAGWHYFAAIAATSFTAWGRRIGGERTMIDGKRCPTGSAGACHRCC